jgi:2-methylisocitrate lyase-like PEP mutase family enzyme
LATVEDIAAVVKAVAPKPVNVLVGRGFTTVAELAAIGVRRISVGSALARTAWAGFFDVAKEIAEQGTFTGFSRSIPVPQLNGLFGPISRHGRSG